MKYRKEKDTMGTVKVPQNAYYGAQTQRAVDNFAIGHLTIPASFIHSLALLKKCAARINKDLGLLDAKLADAIEAAAQEVMDGKLDDQFVVNVFQTGSGTSTNMNMNEVVACRANEILSGKKNSKSPIHPNDHVNLGQSSNDVIPSVIHIAALVAIRQDLMPALQSLQKALAQ
ncbi:MAG: lyase family protein, partial [Desulfobacterales bacterium]